jgi:ribonuclease Z
MRAIRDVVTMTTMTDNQIYQHRTWRIMAAAVEHGHQLGLTQAEWPCLGYRIEAGGKRIVISGDTIACPSLIALAQDVDVLVQCCYLADAALTTPARQLLAKVVIASSGQVGKIAAQAGVKMLVLTHFSDMPPELLASVEADVRRDYDGPVYLGEDLLTIEV